VKELFEECKDPLIVKQMGVILGQASVNFEIEDDDDMNEMIGNMNLSEMFLNLGKELDVMDAKTPEDIYKSHLSHTGSTARRRENVSIDSAKKNLASTFVNAFVNAGFNTDKLMTTEDSWVFKNKDQGMMCAAASLGMIMLWNVDEGLATLDKFLTNENENVKVRPAPFYM
jgi:26S proteasome regulatory subunit N1